MDRRGADRGKQMIAVRCASSVAATPASPFVSVADDRRRRRRGYIALAALAVSLLLLTIASAQSTPADSLQTFQTRYYILKTDIANDEAREAALRMTKMAEEYAARTRDFAGEIRQKFPFYL